MRHNTHIGACDQSFSIFFFSGGAHFLPVFARITKDLKFRLARGWGTRAPPPPDRNFLFVYSSIGVGVCQILTVIQLTLPTKYLDKQKQNKTKMPEVCSQLPDFRPNFPRILNYYFFFFGGGGTVPSLPPPPPPPRLIRLWPYKIKFSIYFFPHCTRFLCSGVAKIFKGGGGGSEGAKRRKEIFESSWLCQNGIFAH